MSTLFERRYAGHYAGAGRLAIVPLVLIGLFGATLGLLCLLKTDKIVVAEGQILPRKSYVSTLGKRAFLVSGQTRVGRVVRRGDVLAQLRFDDGSAGAVSATHDGVIVATGLANVLDGPLEEGLMLASVVAPDELELRIAVPEQLRGSVGPGALVRYKFDVLTTSYNTSVLQADAGLGADGRVAYHLYAALQDSHRRIAFLGRSFPVKIVIKDVSLLDYFFSYSAH